MPKPTPYIDTSMLCYNLTNKIEYKRSIDRMNVAYIFATDMASTFTFTTIILPQLEVGNHSADAAGMFFFDDNLYSPRKGDLITERLNIVAAEKNILLMGCDQCAVRRNLSNGEFGQCGNGEVTPKNLIDNAPVGRFPQLYAALAPAENNPVITL